MYPPTNYVQYAQSQPNVNIQSVSSSIPYNTPLPGNHSLSQPTASQQAYPPQAALNAGQPQSSISILDPAHLQPAEQQWLTLRRKRGRKTEDQENPNENTQEYWLGGAIPTANRFSTFSEEHVEEAAQQSAEPKPPPIFISGVKNIKPLTETINTIAKDKYLLKTAQRPSQSTAYRKLSIHYYSKIINRQKHGISHLQTQARQKLPRGPQEHSPIQ